VFEGERDQLEDKGTEVAANCDRNNQTFVINENSQTRRSHELTSFIFCFGRTPVRERDGYTLTKT